MNINSLGQQPPIQPNRNDQAKLPLSANGNGSSKEEVIVIKGEVPELPRLTLKVLGDKLKSESGIREDIVAEARAKMNSGEYLSTKSAEDTARGILGL